MQLRNRIASLAAAALFMVSAAAAQAQTDAPAFVAISDAVPGRFFDAATTAASATDPGTLVVGFNTGRDPGTWKSNDFRAATAPYSHRSAMDTISFTIVAPAGHYIASVTYTQQGSGSVWRTGQVVGGSTWVVGDYAGDLGVFGTSGNLTGTVDLGARGQYWTELPVSITTGIVAFAAPGQGLAAIMVTGAEVHAEFHRMPVVE
jgi:ABC-type amino acid transport substrate-binding protein